MQRFLLPCVALGEDAQLQRRLRSFLSLLCKHFPPTPTVAPELAACNFYGSLKDVLEKRLLTAASDKTPSQLQQLLEAAQQGQHPTPAPRTASALGYPVVQLLEAMAVAVPEAPPLLEPYGAALLKLAGRLMRDHAQACNILARPPSQHYPSGVLGDLSAPQPGLKVVATPSAALVDEALHGPPPHPLTPHPSHPQHQQLVLLQQHTDPHSPDDSVLCLIACLKLLGQHCITQQPNRLLEHRKPLYQVTPPPTHCSPRIHLGAWQSS